MAWHGMRWRIQSFSPSPLPLLHPYPLGDGVPSPPSLPPLPPPPPPLSLSHHPTPPLSPGHGVPAPRRLDHHARELSGAAGLEGPPRHEHRPTGACVRIFIVHCITLHYTACVYVYVSVCLRAIEPTLTDQPTHPTHTHPHNQTPPPPTGVQGHRRRPALLPPPQRKLRRGGAHCRRLVFRPPRLGAG
jgi:hypothetical protein